MKRITVLLAEDHAVVRDGLRALLLAESDIEVVGEATTGREAVHRARELAPAVVVMDIAMPMLNGLEATRQILKAAPATRILILSAHGDDEYVEQAIDVGAAGFLVKQTPYLVLAEAIRQAGSGRAFYSAGVSRRVLERLQDGRLRADGRKVERAGSALTAREMEVLQLIAEGKANKQTAAELGISMKTVEKHRQHLMSKLDIHDTAGLTRYAISTGLIEGVVRITTE